MDRLNLLVGLERHGGTTFFRWQGTQIRFLVVVVRLVVVGFGVVVVLIVSAAVLTIAGLRVVGALVLYKLIVFRSPFGPLEYRNQIIMEKMIVYLEMWN